MEISEDIIDFLRSQKFVIVATLDDEGMIHCVAKGLVEAKTSGKIFLIDFFSGRTLKNLEKRPSISITAVDESKFLGYTLQGEGRILSQWEVYKGLIDQWQNFVIRKISERIAKSVHAGKKSKEIFETRFLASPRHLIEIDVKNIIDLAPDRKTQGEKHE